MSYVDGFVLAVPKDKLEAYKEIALKVGAISKEHGALAVVECIGDDLPYGEHTSFPRAVQATEDEVVVFSWIVYASRADRDAINAKVMADPRLKCDPSDMPFDAKRMIIGGFEVLVDEGEPGGGFVDGWIVPVPTAKRDAYREHAARNAQYFREYGALRLVEAIADDVKHGQVTDFYRAIKAEPDETIVFAFIEWPDKATRDTAWGKIMNDERMMPEGEAPFNGQRMFWGGFDKMTDSATRQTQQAQAPVNA